MQPTIKLKTKTAAFQYIWMKTVKGFDQRFHCYDCLVGERSSLIPINGGKKYPAGLTVEGKIEESKPCVYFCCVVPSAMGIKANVHILMVTDETSGFTHDDTNICVNVTGMRRVAIEPLPPEAQEILPELYWRCRNFQAGWQMFPNCRQPFSEVPGPLRTFGQHDDSFDVPSAKDYKEAFLRMEKKGLISENHMTMLEAHFSAQNSTETVIKLAKSVGYKGYKGVNGQYGSFARRLCNELRRELKTWLWGLATWDNKSKHLLVMRPPVVQALKELGWFGKRKKSAFYTTPVR